MEGTRSTSARESPPLDARQLVRRCMGNIEFAERMLASFERRFACDVEIIESSATAGDVDKLVCIAHQLKGATANVAAPDLARVLGRIEELGRENRLDEIAARLAELRDEWDRFADFSRSLSLASTCS